MPLFSPQTGQKISRFGAALGGRLPQFDVAQAAQQERLSADRKKAMALDTRSALRMMNAGNRTGAADLLRDRIGRVGQLGGDPSHSVKLLSTIEDQNVPDAEIIKGLQTIDFRAVDAGLLEALPAAPKDKVIKTIGGKVVVQKPDGEFEAVDISGLSPADQINDKSVQSSKILPGGIVQVVFKDGSIQTLEATPAEQALIKSAEQRGVSLAAAKAGERAGAGVRGRGAEARIQKTIGEGVDAVKGIPILRRSLMLLQRIETGGIDAARLRAKQLFGVEGADEGELSANLGRAVLARLRETFGAQFTEREGARLERMSAGFGKSPASNKRILRSSLKLIQGAAERGLDAAADSGDTAAANQISDFLDGKFDLTDEGLANIFTPTETAPQGVPEAATTTPAITPAIPPAPQPAPSGIKFLGFE